MPSNRCNWDYYQDSLVNSRGLPNYFYVIARWKDMEPKTWRLIGHGLTPEEALAHAEKLIVYAHKKHPGAPSATKVVSRGQLNEMTMVEGYHVGDDR